MAAEFPGSLRGVGAVAVFGGGDVLCAVAGGGPPRFTSEALPGGRGAVPVFGGGDVLWAVTCGWPGRTIGEC